ncbi:MAG: histidine kinase dimerization/phosphoacceptor domain-containing protein [Anaerolineae bacterium]
MLSQAKSTNHSLTLGKSLTLGPSTLRRRLRRLQFVIPLGLFVLVVLYELGPAEWIHQAAGESYHMLAELLVYGTIGPALAYVLLHFVDRWLEERETTEAQSQLLAQIEARANVSSQLHDDALQTLFAASLLLASLKSKVHDLSPSARADLKATEQAIDRAIQQLRHQLLAHPPRD